jgi:UDP-glucose:(heptosyl)LPS alpha-1,3-glucosyltransferase
MKVALLIERFDPIAGGAEGYAHHFSAFLAREGHLVDVLCLTADHPPPNVNVRILPVLRLPLGLGVLGFARACRKVVAREGYDVVHGLMKCYGMNVFHPHTGSHSASVAASLQASRPLSRAFRTLAKTLSIKQAVFRHIENRQYALEPPGLFVAVSARVRDDMVRLHGVAPNRIRTIANGVDLRRFNPKGSQDPAWLRAEWKVENGNLAILFAAHNFRLKGLETLLRALPLLPKESGARARVVVAGRDRPGPFLRLAGRLGIASQVHFAGPLPDMPAAYRAADLFVLPTYYDPCSLTVLEAMATATPVLTSARNGASELFEHRRDWILPDPADAADLARLMAPFFDDETRSRAGADALAAAAELDEEDAFRKMLDVYREVAGTGARPSGSNGESGPNRPF